MSSVVDVICSSDRRRARTTHGDKFFRSRPHLAKPDFHPYLAVFGQTEYGQYHIWPNLTGRIWPTLFDRIWPDRIWPFFFWLGGGRVGWCGPKGWGPKGWGPEVVGGPKVGARWGGGRSGWGPNPEKVGPRRVEGPKFRAFFSLSRPKFLLSSLSGGSFRGILVVFLKAGALKCARLEFSGCCVKPPVAPHNLRQNTKNKNYGQMRSTL